jgi:small GTP-binding protein
MNHRNSSSSAAAQLASPIVSAATAHDVDDPVASSSSPIITYEPTLGANFRETHLEINQQKVILHVWDTGGDPATQILSRSTYKYSDCLILVFDLSSRSSFEHIDLYWNNYVKYNELEGNDEFPALLVGNKCDCSDQDRKITYEEILTWCAAKRADNPIIYMGTYYV